MATKKKAKKKAREKARSDWAPMAGVSYGEGTLTYRGRPGLTAKQRKEQDEILKRWAKEAKGK